MGHPQLWWLLIAPRRDGSDLYGPEAEERSDQTADLVPPPIYVTQLGSNWGPNLGRFMLLSGNQLENYRPEPRTPAFSFVQLMGTELSFFL
jgi:hypothetical protein